MATFFIKESQDVRDTRDMTEIEDLTLGETMKAAVDGQFFCGTTVSVYDEEKNLICYKEAGRKWISA